MKRYLADVVQQDEYQIGTTGGTVSGLPDRGALPVSRGGSRNEVAWRGDLLWIYRETYAASGANITRKGETWRIDDVGRLVISIETRDNDEAAATQTLTYRREKQ